jgi:hypothetical protein
MVRILDEDGTLHFNHLKRINESGVQYLHSVNNELEPTSDMLVGTAMHFQTLGKRPESKDLAVFTGKVRKGKEWDAFEAEHADEEILSQSEWDKAELMTKAIRRSPLAQRRLAGARFETPMKWEENGIPCSTTGIDIITTGLDLGDLKSAACTEPEAFKRVCFSMGYAQQLAFYRRGARANGIDVRKLFILGVDRPNPRRAIEVVEFVLDEDLIEHAEKSLTLSLERLRSYMLSIPEPKDIYDWPGYSESPIVWSLPSWMTKKGEDEDLFEDEEAA